MAAVTEAPLLGETYQTLILRHILILLDIPQVALDLDSSFVSSGGCSTAAIALSTACKCHGIGLRVADIMLGSTLEEVLKMAIELPETNLQDKVLLHPCRVCSGSTSQMCNRGQKLEGLRKFAHSSQSACYVNTIPKEAVQDYTQNGRFQSSNMTVESPFSSSCGYITPPESIHGRKRKRDSLLDADCALAKSPKFDSAESSESLLDHESSAPITEMQLQLVHGSWKRPGSNIIRFTETYRLSDLQAVKAAWERVLTSENLFGVDMNSQSDGGIIYPLLRPELRWDVINTDNRTDYKTHIDRNITLLENAMDFKAVILNSESPNSSIVTIVWSAHHALMDGYSASLLYKKFQRAINNLPIKPGTSFVSVARQLVNLQYQDAERCKNFWLKQNARHPSAIGHISLPKPSGRSLNNSNLADCIGFQSPDARLRAVSMTNDCTLASMYTAAWALVLSRYCASDSTVFGLVHSARSLPLAGVEDTIGQLTNTLPLYVEVNPTLSVAAFARNVFKSMVALGEISHSRSSDGFERRFSSAIATEFEMTPLPDTCVKPIQLSSFSVASDIPLSVCILGSGHVQIFYQTDLFNNSDIHLLAEHFKRTLEMFCEPEKLLSDCIENFLDQSCKESMLKTGNVGLASTRSGNLSETLASLFKKAAYAFPHEIAVEKGDKQLNYEELRKLVHRTAGYIGKIVRQGDVVFVYADRSVNWIVAIYAVIVLGGVYTPVDPALSAQARLDNYQTANGKAFITPYREQECFKPSSCDAHISIEEILENPGKPVAESPRMSIKPSDPAYVCFTSGSTGLPKAVLCTHEGVTAFQQDLEVRLHAAPGVRIAQTMSPAFDGSIHEIFSALSYGATLVLSSSDASIVDHISSVNSVLMTPTLAKALDPLELPSLHHAYFVGEAVPQVLCDEWASCKSVYNMYGPTESTCGATISRLRCGEEVTIGRPNCSSRVYILDAKQRLLPPGVPGEICIAGVQVSRGYIGRPSETHEKFMKDCISREWGEDMYRTGDFGYWTSEGTIFYLGRQDRQIKLQGFRLDLNNIEHRLSSVMKEATFIAVVRQQDWLVAIFQPRGLDLGEIKRKATSVLQPRAMPRYFTTIDTLPMTKVGKVDYTALARLNLVPTQTQHQTTLTRAETQMAKMWKETLQLPDTLAIEPDANFLSLGGHSILQLMLSNRITNEMNCEVEYKKMIEAISTLSLRQLVCLIDSTHSAPPTVMSRSNSSVTLGQVMLSPIEKQWFYRYLQDDHTSQFNVSIAWNIDSTVIDRNLLAHAWNAVINKHYILRSQFVLKNKGRVERNRTGEALQIQLMADEFSLEKVVNEPFVLNRGPLVRVFISSRKMVLVASHILLDLTAAASLLHEVACTYMERPSETSRRAFEQTSCWFDIPDPVSLSFMIENLRHPIKSRWNRVIDDTRQSCAGKSLVFELGRPLPRKIRRLSQGEHVTNHQITLAAVALALNEHFPSDDVLLGGPYINRSSTDADTIGLFLETLPFKITIPGENGTLAASEIGDDQMIAFLHDVQETSQNALAHAIPWTQFLRHLGIELAMPSHFLFDAVVTYHEEQMSGMLELPGLEPLMTWSDGAKFRLLFEFISLNDGGLILRVEYAEASYTADEVRSLAYAVKSHLYHFCSATSGSAAGPSSRGSQEKGDDLSAKLSEVEDAFGMQYSDFNKTTI